MMTRTCVLAMAVLVAGWMACPALGQEKSNVPRAAALRAAPPTPKTTVPQYKYNTPGTGHTMGSAKAARMTRAAGMPGSSGTKNIVVTDQDIEGITDVNELMDVLNYDVPQRGVRKVNLLVDLRNPLCVELPRGTEFKIGHVDASGRKVGSLTANIVVNGAKVTAIGK